MPKDFDFCGYATRNDLKCSDGRTIRKNAFAHCDGVQVPLVWNHKHDKANNVLGHAILENREDGVYAYGYFNNNEEGQTAKELVKHGDIKALSIFANNLKEQAGNVFHGVIREVSLVLAGANPGAYIDSVLAHGEGSVFEEELFNFCTEAESELRHSGTEEESKETDPAKEITHSEEGKEKDEKKDMPDKTVKEVIDSMTEEQKKVLHAMVGMALEEANGGEGAKEEGKEMKHNVFDGQNQNNENVLSHSELEEIVRDAKRNGSMKDAFLSHGIEDVEYLFPDNKNLTTTPTFINNEPSDWVNVVMNGVKHTPFSRVKMMFADIREDEARAKGYIKGNLKKEEVFTLLKRTISPTTVYKLQKMDRDDVIDITDFDVIAWIKTEMRLKLNEELARAFLFGDGRLTSSNDHISHLNIIPAISDASLYTITKTVTPEAGESDPHAVIRSVVEAMDDFQGGSNTIAFLPQKSITKMLLMEDTLGHRLYKNLGELADAMTVNRIVKVPASIIPTGYLGLVLDLNDYNVGADKGGAVNMFDDFDINYNKLEYLIETRCSGGLVKPFAAIALKTAEAAA